MNIQHLESLSDVVAQITGVQVRERVPDIVLQTRRRCAAGRSRAGRTDRAAEGRQGLSARERQARGRQLLPPRQSDGVARDGAAPHRRPRRRPDGRLSEAERHRRPMADGRAAAGLHRSGSAVREGRAHGGPSGLRPQCAVAGDFDRARRPPAAASRGDAAARCDIQAGGKPWRRDAPGQRPAISSRRSSRLARREHATQIVIGGRRQRFPPACSENRCRMR